MSILEPSSDIRIFTLSFLAVCILVNTYLTVMPAEFNDLFQVPVNVYI